MKVKKFTFKKPKIEQPSQTAEEEPAMEDEGEN